MNLYRKYRPTTFDEMYGNEETIESLQNELQKKDKSHVYLFSGQSGCGKTTAARIMASELNAHGMGIVEINSGNNRGIDTARSITDQMQGYPIDGNIWVFIIDEVHKSTNDYQNAMLKPLEDTPSHVYFILCTTNPEKLIKPLRNRCTHHVFNSLPENDIYKLLVRVHKKESGKLDKDILKKVSENCNGSPRKSLVLLEKIIVMEDEKKILKIITDGVDEDNEKEIKKIGYLLLNDNSSWNSICNVLNQLKDEKVEVEKIRYMVLGYMQAVLLKGSQNNKAASIMSNFIDPFYNSGFSGLVLACYDSLYSN